MSNLLGVELGGTKVTFVLADNSGRFLFEKTYPSPFRKTGRTLEDGTPEVFLDNPADMDLSDTPVERKVYEYLFRVEDDFIRLARQRVGTGDYEQKGMSVCGKTWVHKDRVVMIGGNTPSRFASDLGDGRIGITVADHTKATIAANDGNAAATAQGIWLQVRKQIPVQETGYMILGTGFGFGVPGYHALTELGHAPVTAMPWRLWQQCGCTDGAKTACVENYASGRGIAQTARLLLSMAGQDELRALSPSLRHLSGGRDLNEMVTVSQLKRYDVIDTAAVMRLAKYETDGLASFAIELAAEVTAYAAVTAAYLFGLQVIGIGETVARENPWHVENIADKVDAYVKGSTILRPRLRAVPTPIKDPSKFGALSLVIPEAAYDDFAEQMGMDASTA